MNIDERLEKLAERHEALTQSVEMLVARQQKTDEMLQQLTRQTRRFERIVLMWGVDMHERLERLEDRLDEQDGKNGKDGKG